MKKDLEYYMGLGYVIEITKIPADEGGGYSAEIPQLGRYAFVGDGETVEEAIQNLELAKRDLFESYLERGISIPEPEPEESEEYSGRFVIRMPITLHAELSKQAKKNGCSLNQYTVSLLSAAVIARGIGGMIERQVLKIEQMRFDRATEDFWHSLPKPAASMPPQSTLIQPNQQYRKTG